MARIISVAVLLVTLLPSVRLQANDKQLRNRYTARILPGTEGEFFGRGVVLDGRDLAYVRLFGNLSDSSFDSSNLFNASLRSANLTGANLSGANLTDADLGGTSLTNTNFVGAVVTGANFYRTTPEFTEAQVGFHGKLPI